MSCYCLQNEHSEGAALVPYASRLIILDESLRAKLGLLSDALEAIMRSFEGEGLLALAGPVGRAKTARKVPTVRRRYNFYEAYEAESRVRWHARRDDAEICPFADPIYWAGFQIIGW